MKWLWLTLCVVGAVVPYYFLLPFLFEHGLDIGQLAQLATTNTIAIGGIADLLISCFVFWMWMYRESAQRGIRYWWVYVVVTLLVGLSFALPLFLFVREGRN
ncbi:MAG: DUF2834 domain-containing protein [Anaerolineales bacterium]